MTEWLHWTDWAYWISFLFLLNSSSCLFRRRQWQPTPVLLPGKSHGRREESDMTERLHFSLSYIGEGNGNPLQCSCLENPRDSWAWWAAIYGVAQNWTQLKRLTSSSNSCLFTLVNYLQILNNIAIEVVYVILCQYCIFGSETERMIHSTSIFWVWLGVCLMLPHCWHVICKVLFSHLFMAPNLALLQIIVALSADLFLCG